MRIVVDLDTLRRSLQLEHFRHFGQQARLAGRLGQLARQGFPRIARGLGDKVLLAAPFGTTHFHLAPGFQLKRVSDQFGLVR